jgi:hypothetical protein
VKEVGAPVPQIGLATRALLGPAHISSLLRITSRLLDPFYRDVNSTVIVGQQASLPAPSVGQRWSRLGAAAQSDHPGPVWLATGCVTLGLFFFCHGS